MLNTLKILGVTITNEKKEKVLEYLFERIKKPGAKTFIVTPNPEMLVYATKHLAYRNKLNSSTIAIPDGIGLFLASLITGNPLRARIPGVDFIEDICNASVDKPLSIGFLGGRKSVAKQTAERLLEKYPHLTIVFAGSEWPTQDRLKTIDVLFVAYGVPKQEDWIYENLDKLPVKAAMGVGGSFDFLSGQVARAPHLLRQIGLEWFYRLVTQPWRWKRQLALIEFIFLVCKENFF